ncbi:MAG: membrane fusion protein [Rhodobacteraceae bacterium HLUCCA12]|nr:MAG: membrane fusion protein [Rhodobacteraceae bacterium HLUCCA12]
MIKRLVIVIVLLVLVVGGLIGFNLFRDRMIADFFADMPVQPLPVEVIEAREREWQPTLAAIGTVHAAQGVDLTVEAAGIVREIAFEPNTDVTEGQTLLRLDSEVQGADLTAARAQMELERANLARQRQLQSRGVASDVTLDQTRAGYAAAEAQLARAEAVIAQRALRAPFSGTIGLARVDLGEYVSPGTIVTTLQDLETMRVDFSLPERTLPYLTIGQRLHVRIEGDTRRFDGAITGIDPRVDPGSRMVALRGTVDNPDFALTPGQFARVEIDLPLETGVIALPQTAVTSSLYGDFVYVVEDRDDGQIARQIFVTPGRRSEGLIEIAEGLAPGDRVVASGQNRLSNRAPVTIAETQAPATEPAQ